MRHTIVILTLFFLQTSLFGAVWQWSTQIKSETSSETNDHPRAFLWIPPDCNHVRGIVVGMHNMQEEGIFENETFRKTMTEIGFAEIWVTPGLDPLFDPAKGAQIAFDEILDSLAIISGYSELKYAPIIPIGHSAYASYPWNFGVLNPERTLAMISVHGDAPQTNLTGCGRPNLDWGDRTIDDIPGLMVMGEYEWWEDRLKPAIDYKNRYPQSPISLLADAGHGHFDHSDMLIDYLALFIKKAARYRLSDQRQTNKGVSKMNPIDPRDGWLADRWHKDEKPYSSPAPYHSYQGNKETAFWYFDKEIAGRTEAYYATARGKKEQYIGFMQNGELIPFDMQAHARMFVKFMPENDGLTFHVTPVFTDTLRSRLSDDHSEKGKIRLDRICGPVEKMNDTTFTVRFYRMGFDNPKRTGDGWLIASHPGDDTYKSSVQQLNIRIPYPHTQGIRQQITFPALNNVRTETRSILPNATSDSGLPVYYYVKEGPAEMKDGKVVLTKIPPRSRFPVKVTVVAWQYGLNGDLKIQTAEPVERSFYIEEKK